MPPEAILDFSNNCDTLVAARTAEALRGVSLGHTAYPELGAPALATAIACHEAVPDACVLPTHGASEAILLAFAALRPRRVMLVGPIFAEYARMADALAIPWELEPLDPAEDFGLTSRAVETLARRLETAHADCLTLCTPNNPTGQVYDRLPELVTLLRRRGRPVRVVVDQAYREFLHGESGYAASAWRTLMAPVSPVLASQDPVEVVAIGSLTKAFCCPGLRLGYVLAQPETVARLAALQPPWSVTTPAQTAGVRFLGQVDAYRADRLHGTAGACAEAARPCASSQSTPAGPMGLAELRNGFAKALAEAPGVARVLPSRTNFLCVQLAPDADGGALAEGLARRGVLIRCCDDIPGMAPGYVRLQVKDATAQARLLTAWREVV